MKISLKGEALLCAIEAGLVQATTDGGGYDVGPFLKFWDAFSLLLPKCVEDHPDEIQNVVKMVKEYRNQCAEDQQ